MVILRAYLIIAFVAMLYYTVIVASSFGMNILPIAFELVGSMTWPGQFTLDFATYLWLSALWVAWRHKFSAIGIILGLIASVGGMLFLAIYLLVESLRVNGDMKALVLGRQVEE